MPSRPLTLWCLTGLVLTLLSAPAQAQDADPAQLWDDFIHYGRIARVELARDAAVALMESVDDEKLLDVVEASVAQGRVRDVESALEGLRKYETLADAVNELSLRIQKARIQRIRDPQRIMDDIKRLAEGPLAFRNAMQRLQAAGQFAAPHLLRVLNDDRQANLHPYVVRASIVLGRPVVYPFATALRDLETAPKLVVAQILADIGYPRALPYMKEALDAAKPGSTVHTTLSSAYDQLARGNPAATEASAAALFLASAKELYREATRTGNLPGYDPQTKRGIVWVHSVGAGLVSVPVPGPIFGDVMAMHEARRALSLDNDLSDALTLWLAANLRRENRVPAGQDDPSYSRDQNPPAFWAMAAGPGHVQKILEMAIDDRDPALALDAIDAIIKTGGSKVMFESEQGTTTLVRALTFPDREVRLHVAWALAAANPQVEFPGSQRVVPTLIEGVRQTGKRVVLVLAPNESRVNTLKADMRDLGYAAIGGTDLKAVTDELSASAGVDLILVADVPATVEQVLRTTESNHQLAATPILALGNEAQQIELRQRLLEEPRVTSALEAEDPTLLQPAIDAAMASYAGSVVDPEKATQFALRSLELLELAARSHSQVYDVSAAEQALIQALADERENVVIAAARVLSLLSSESGQLALADAALETARSQNVRVALLGSLGDSLKQFGNTLPSVRVDQLRELVQNSSGELAVAAARAFGAGNQPTDVILPLIPGK